MLFHTGVKAQVYDTIPGQQYEYDRQGRPMKKDSTSQTLKHRDVNEDSITVYYRYWDSSRTNKLDSSINDFFTRFPSHGRIMTWGISEAPRNHSFFIPE
jgi:hypothetical protein